MRTILENLLTKPLWMLEDLGFRLMLQPPQERMTRRHWAELDEAGVRGIRVQDLRGVLMQEEWRGLCGSAETDPEAPDGWRISLKALHADEELSDSFDKLERFGLAYRTRSAAFVLPEAVTAAQMDGDDADESTYLLRLTDGLLRTVGCAPLKEMAHMIDLRADLELNVSVQPVLPEWMTERMARLWQLRMGMDGVRLVDGSEMWLVAEQCQDPTAVLRGQLFGKGKDLKYPRFTARQVGEISLRGNPVPWNKTEPVMRLLLTQGMSPAEAERFLGHTAVLVQREQQGPAAQLLGEAIPDSPSPTRMRQISDFYDSVPQWTLRGHSDAELNPSPLREKPHARPDGLCSCGSGRPYVRCCGRLN